MLILFQKLFYYSLCLFCGLQSLYHRTFHRKGHTDCFTLYDDLKIIRNNLVAHCEKNNIEFFLVDKTHYHHCYGCIENNPSVVIFGLKNTFNAYSVYFTYLLLGKTIVLPFRLPLLMPKSLRISPKIIIHNRLYHKNFAYIELQFWSQSNATNTHNQHYAYPITNATFNDFAFSDAMPDIASLNKTSTAMIASHIDRIDFPIDAVYTWVNPNDTEWFQAKNSLLNQLSENVHDASISSSRFNDYDELKHSIQSLRMYAPFVRHIYIVTSSGKPDWLNGAYCANDPAISMVYHKDIFNNLDHLPTFNSHAIETCLHRINGLSEHFLYVNDDVFLNSFCSANDFFYSNGIAKSFYSKKRIGLLRRDENTEAPTTAALKNREIIRQKYHKVLFNGFAKTPTALSVSTLKALENDFKNAFCETETAKFRNKNDISTTSSLVHYHSMIQGTSVIADIGNLTIGLDNKLYFLKIFYLLLMNRSEKIKTLCINEADNKNDPATVKKYLNLYFHYFSVKPYRPSSNPLTSKGSNNAL